MSQPKQDQPRKGMSFGVMVALAVAIATAVSAGSYGHHHHSTPVSTQSN